MGSITVIQSQKEGAVWHRQLPPVCFQPDINGEEMRLLMIYSDIRYQEVKGFGGALTQASAYCYDGLDEAHKQELLKLYFSKEGLAYNAGRTHIGSCDFSFGNYNYCVKKEESLDSFSLACDEDYVLPFLKQVTDYCVGSFSLFASPWSPPAWMKTNNSLIHGGELKEEYYPLYAEYLARYIKEYEKAGIRVDRITIQNEPKAVQTWESCIYTPEQEKRFICDYLYPRFQKEGINTKIIIWDHNKERVFTRARAILSDPAAREIVSGIAFHWYSGDHFENLRLCWEFFPDKELLFTEGCVELTTTATSMAEKAAQSGNQKADVENSPWEFGEYYAHDMIGNFNNGMSTFIDWNLALDMQGGPNHVGNYCSAPVICDIQEQKLYLQPSYYFIGHFSKFIPIGSRRIAYSTYNGDLMTSAFITPEQKKVVVVLNKTGRDIPFTLKDEASDQIAFLTANAKSIMTLIYE